MKGKAFVITNTIIAALGGFLFGFDTAVISGTTSDLERVFELDANLLGFTVAVALIGTIIGTMIVGKPSDIYGRKKVMLVLALFYTISALGSALVDNWYSFLFYRLLGGVAVGGSSVLGPMYIAEISPAHLRGRLVAVQQFNVVLGILIAFLSNYLIADLIEISAWRWMFGVEALPAAAFFFLLFIIPGSPRWLIGRGMIEEARDILTKMGEPNVEQEIEEIKLSLQSEEKLAEEPLFQKKYRVPIGLAVAIAAFNQLAGINIIMYYAPRVFEMTGATSDTALLQAVIIGATNLFFTILAMTMIDRFGRRTLMLIGSVGLVISLALVSYTFWTDNFSGYSVVLYLIMFIASFAFSQGAVIWPYISEVFPNKVRAKGQALGSFTHWTMAALVSWTFPVLADVIGGGPTFMVFSLIMVLQFFWALKIMRETKGKSLEQIERELGIVQTQKSTSVKAAQT